MPFRYQLSDWRVFSIRRRLRVCAFGLDDADQVNRPFVAPPIPSDADGTLLRSVPQGDDAGNSVFRIDNGPLCYVLARFPRYYIDMGQSFADYQAKFSAKTRATLNRKVRKFTQHCGGHLRWQVYRQEADLDEFMRLARQVSARTYQERLLDTGLPDDAGFLDEARRLAANDALRAFLLFDGERPVSYLYCPVHDGVIDYAYLGYDPDYMHLSIGSVLQWLALETLFDEKQYRYFDFTEGESEHKKLFATGCLSCANVAFLSPTLAHFLLAYSHYYFGRISTTLGHWLERHGLKARLKRWLRHGSVGARETTTR